MDWPTLQEAGVMGVRRGSDKKATPRPEDEPERATVGSPPRDARAEEAEAPVEDRPVALPRPPAQERRPLCFTVPVERKEKRPRKREDLKPSGFTYSVPGEAKEERAELLSASIARLNASRDGKKDPRPKLPDPAKPFKQLPDPREFKPFDARQLPDPRAFGAKQLPDPRAEPFQYRPHQLPDPRDFTWRYPMPEAGYYPRQLPEIQGHGYSRPQLPDVRHPDRYGRPDMRDPAQQYGRPAAEPAQQYRMPPLPDLQAQGYFYHARPTPDARVPDTRLAEPPHGHALPSEELERRFGRTDDAAELRRALFASSHIAPDLPRKVHCAENGEIRREKHDERPWSAASDSTAATTMGLASDRALLLA